MSIRGERSISLAIVVAGLAIAAGLYFGLRAQAPATPPAPPPSPVTATPPPVTPTPPVSPAQVRQQAVEALAYQRRTLYDRCFRPAQAAEPDLTMVLMFDVAFDAEGRQLGRGVVEQPGTSTAALTRCVTDHLAPLRVPPPGTQVQVEVPLQFP